MRYLGVHVPTEAEGSVGRGDEGRAHKGRRTFAAQSKLRAKARRAVSVLQPGLRSGASMARGMDCWESERVQGPRAHGTAHSRAHGTALTA